MEEPKLHGLNILFNGKVPEKLSKQLWILCPSGPFGVEDEKINNKTLGGALTESSMW